MPKNHETEDTEPSSEDRAKLTVGSGTAVQLALVIALLGATATGAWKMSGISAKLDNIASMLSTTSTATSALERRESDHEREDARIWTVIQSEMNGLKAEVANLRQSGSVKVQEVERQLTELKFRYDMHAKETKP